MQQGSQARDKLVEHLLEVIEVPVPDTLVERELEWRTRAMEGELQQAGMDWDAYFTAAGIEGREAYDADMRTNVENAVRTQFVLDAIADAREVTVDNDDLSAQIMAQAQRNRVSPEQYAQQLQQGNNIADFVADVRRTKALAQLLESTTITDASGDVVDLEALRPGPTAPGTARPPPRGPRRRTGRRGDRRRRDPGGPGRRGDRGAGACTGRRRPPRRRRRPRSAGHEAAEPAAEAAPARTRSPPGPDRPAPPTPAHRPAVRRASSSPGPATAVLCALGEHRPSRECPVGRAR